MELVAKLKGLLHDKVTVSVEGWDVVLERMQEARELAEAEEKTKLLPAKGDD